MRLFDRFPLPRPQRAGGFPGPTLPWYRRWWFIASVVIVLVAVGTLAIVRPWRSPCGSGLVDEGTPYVCVGLDVDSTAFQESDPLTDLESRISALNEKITGDYVTVVVLDNMAPNPNTDSESLDQVRHRVEGAITATWRANNQAVAGGSNPSVKLMLASFGSGASHQDEAVRAIVQAKTSQHIVAVTGFGQSLDQTRQAAKDLSDANIVSVGSTVTADNMNEDASGQPIPNFFRVAATNKDGAEAEVSYMANHDYRKALLIKDVNPDDSYDTSLATDFGAAFRSRYGFDVPFTEPYQSPRQPVTSSDRDHFMTDQFAHMHPDICADKPDLIYFAGRGLDLLSLLKALAQGGGCGLGPIDVFTGDDIVGQKLPPPGALSVRVFYTALATADEWKGFPTTDDTTQNYAAFAEAFSRETKFDPKHLQSEDAIMSHDAVLAAALAARLDPLATTDSSTVKAYFLRLRCTQFVPGASGDITFDSKGNPVDKAVPLLQLMPDGSAELREVTWPTGVRFDPRTTC